MCFEVFAVLASFILIKANGLLEALRNISIATKSTQLLCHTCKIGRPCIQLRLSDRGSKMNDRIATKTFCKPKHKPRSIDEEYLKVPGCPPVLSTSLQSLSSSPSKSSSPFFIKLRAEIRQQVYVHAIGDGSIHIDLQYNHARRRVAFHANRRLA